RYRIVSLAGRGGMGEVYRADDLKLGHPVALKFLPREVKEGSRSFQHFLSEVRLSRQIAHPNVYSPTTLLTTMESFCKKVSFAFSAQFLQKFGGQSVTLFR